MPVEAYCIDGKLKGLITSLVCLTMAAARMPISRSGLLDAVLLVDIGCSSGQYLSV